MDAEPQIDRAPRVSVMLTAHLFRAGEVDGSQHRILNISTVGVCIAQAAGLVCGDTVSVAIGQAESVVADVVWMQGGAAGLRFHREIDLTTARLRRSGCSAPPTSGWLADLNNAYHRR